MEASAEASSQFLRPAALHLLSQGCGQGWLLQFKYTCAHRFHTFSFVPKMHSWHKAVPCMGKDQWSHHTGPPLVSMYILSQQHGTLASLECHERSYISLHGRSFASSPSRMLMRHEMEAQPASRARREFPAAEYSVYLMGGANAERKHIYPVYRHTPPPPPPLPFLPVAVAIQRRNLIWCMYGASA